MIDERAPPKRDTSNEGLVVTLREWNSFMKAMAASYSEDDIVYILGLSV